MSTLSDEVKSLRASNPDWDFQTTWDHITKTQPWRFTKSAEANRILAKHQPQKQKEDRAKFEHVECIARRLMARDRSLTFGTALERVRLCLPGAQAEIKGLLQRSKVKATESKPKGRTMLIRGSEGTYVD
jgi:hypothetical protein